MPSVNFDTSVGGDGSTVSDDSNPSTGLANYGWKTRFIPALAQAVAVAGWVKNRALDVYGYANTASSNAASAVANAGESSASASASAASAAQSVSARDLAIAAWSSANAPAESLAAISQSVHFGAVVASCLYDTSKDTDAGQWRKKCSDKSWYTETIQTGKWMGQKTTAAAAWATAGAVTGDYFQNTTDGKFYVLGVSSPTVAEVFRGNAREFPALALIVAETGRVAIYDASAPGCPMWMVFVVGVNFLLNGTTSITSVAALQGRAFIGKSDANNGSTFIDFASDTAILVRDAGHGSCIDNGVTRRNTSFWGSVNYPQLALVNNQVNAVAATVLTDAPIDPLTGLAVPTIAVATGGGVSVLKHDGTVVNSLTTDSVAAASVSGDFLWTNHSAGGAYMRFARLTGLGASFALTTVTTPFSAFPGTSALSATGPAASRRNRSLKGSSSGVSLLTLNPATPASSLLSYITKDYATGWMVGDIKRCLLADTVAETVPGSGELVTNGDFASGATGWTLGTGWSVSAGAAVVNTGGGNGSIYQSPAVNLKTYQITFTITSYTSGALFAIASTTLGPYVTATGTYSQTVVSNGTGGFGVYATAGTIATVDNISVKLVEPDRSVKNRPIAVVGSLTKSPVASGAGLVAYSGFSASNYLEEAYSSDLDFGTGDFCVMGWINLASTGAWQYLFDRGTVAGARINILYAGTGTWYYTCSATGANVGTGVAAVAGLHLVELSRVSGVLRLRVDGVIVYTVSNTVNVTNASGITRIGLGLDGTRPLLSTIALLRVSATVPSDDQAAHIYRTEKPLFAAGAQCTLAGTSNAVTALAYDEETDVWHAGTSWGRTGFRDLLRVDSEVTTVGAVTSISAGQGAVLLGGASSGKYYQPAFLLRDEIRRRNDAKRALGKEPVFFDFDAVTSQTAFPVQQGYTVKAVYSSSTLKRLGSTKDYTVSFDGFRETVNFAVSPGAAAWVSIMAVRA